MPRFIYHGYRQTTHEHIVEVAAETQEEALTEARAFREHAPRDVTQDEWVHEYMEPVWEGAAEIATEPPAPPAEETPPPARAKK